MIQQNSKFLERTVSHPKRPDIRTNEIVMKTGLTKNLTKKMVKKEVPYLALTVENRATFRESVLKVIKVIKVKSKLRDHVTTAQKLDIWPKIALRKRIRCATIAKNLVI
jgi:hypothetical protein